VVADGGWAAECVAAGLLSARRRAEVAGLVVVSEAGVVVLTWPRATGPGPAAVAGS